MDIGRWEQIATSDIWEFTDDQSNILPILKLSYDYLPSHLKRRFAYCSIFPKDYEFQKEELVLLWMTENLLKPSERNRRMGEVGDEYFNDLVSRSFFKQLRTNYNTSCFVMHHLIVDLATSVSGKYCCQVLENGNFDESVKKTHHLACVMKWHDLYDKRFSNDFKATGLRTFLSLRFPGRSSFSKEVVHNLFLKLKCLRVLSFFNSHIDELLDSVGELKHLRYLDLSNTDISILLESVIMLYNLQTLKLNSCSNLKKLPSNMHHLINLRYLNVRFCHKLVEMPRHISKLKNLQLLSTLIVGKGSGAKIGELGKLSGVRGDLLIKRLENVLNVKDASKQANIMDKKHLETLRLEWSYNSGIDDSRHEKDVLDMLLPNRTLKKLEIYEYPGTGFPNWIGNDSFGNIVSLKLSGCRCCLSLPPLRQLPSLKTLDISKFDALEMVGFEFYGNCSVLPPFSSLEILKFSMMPSWERWILIPVEDGGTFAKLRELGISNCHTLIGNLPFFLPSLTKSATCSLRRVRRVDGLVFVCCNNLLSHSESLYEVLEQMEAGPQYLRIMPEEGLPTLFWTFDHF